MRIAWFTPFSNQSAIGTFSQVIVEELAHRVKVELFVPESHLEKNTRQTKVPVHTISNHPDSKTIENLNQYDICIYNLGDHLGNHLACYEHLKQKPGIVILHDLVMRDFFRGYGYEYQDSPYWFYELQNHVYKSSGKNLSRKLLNGELTEYLESPFRIDYPMFQPALPYSLGTIVHSEYALSKVRPVSCVPVVQVDFPTDPNVERYQTQDSCSSSVVRLLSFGVLNPNKMIHLIVDVIGKSDLLRDRILYHIIGMGEPNYVRSLERLIQDYSLQKTVKLLGWRSDEDLNSELTNADIVLNLRNPHLGESSWSLLNSLFSGTATIVWNHGYYSEFPDDVVAKVTSEEELSNHLERLVLNQPIREMMGNKARAYAHERFRTSVYCDRLLEFVETVQQESLLWSLTDVTTNYLHELGCQSTDPLIFKVADQICRFSSKCAA